jgi:hypothetical protein
MPLTLISNVVGLCLTPGNLMETGTSQNLGIKDAEGLDDFHKNAASMRERYAKKVIAGRTILIPKTDQGSVAPARQCSPPTGTHREQLVAALPPTTVTPARLPTPMYTDWSSFIN